MSRRCHPPEMHTGFARVHTTWIERNFLSSGACSGIVSVKVFDVSKPADPDLFADIGTPTPPRSANHVRTKGTARSSTVRVVRKHDGIQPHPDDRYLLCPAIGHATRPLVRVDSIRATTRTAVSTHSGWDHSYRLPRNTWRHVKFYETPIR